MKKIIGIIFLLIMIGIGGGIWMLSQWSSRPRMWKTEKIDTGEIMVTVSATGTVEPTSTVTLGAQISGRVKNVAVATDESVKKDQVLAVLDTELLEAERKESEIHLRRMKVGLELLDVEHINLKLNENRLTFEINQATIAVESAIEKLKFAANELRRSKGLEAGNFVSERDLELRGLEKNNAERELKSRKMESEKMNLMLQKSESDRKGLTARKKQTQTDIDQALQRLEKIKANLQYAIIKTPISGVVLSREIEQGQTIQASFQTPNLFTIAADLTKVNILANIDEADIGRIRSGQKVEFEVDAFRGDAFNGRVVAVRLKHEMRGSLVTYPVVIEADNPPTEQFPNGRLRPGMTAFLTFEIERKTDVIRLPAAALRFAPPEGATVQSNSKPSATNKETTKDKKKVPKGMRATVYLKGNMGDLKPCLIHVGAHSGDYYELVSGDLKPGDELVVSEQTFLKELQNKTKAH